MIGFYYIKHEDTYELKFFEREIEADSYRTSANGMGYNDFVGSFVISHPWSEPKLFTGNLK